MLERASLGKWLTPAKVHFRRCKFLLRKLVKTSYQSLDMINQTFFRVNPKTFFFNMNEDTSQRDTF